MIGWLFWMVAGPLAVVLTITTLFAELDSQRWWIVGCRFLRLQSLFLVLLLGGLGLAMRGFGGWSMVALAAVLAAVHLSHLRRHDLMLWVHRWERSGPIEADLAVATLNVELENESVGDVASFLAACDAEVVLLIEVDETWLEKLDDALEPWPHRHCEPRDDHYGMAMFSKQPFRNSVTHHIGLLGRPAIEAEIPTANGAISVWGLHPEPPHPGVDAHRKEAYLDEAASLIAAVEIPVVAMGDLNDIAWSPGTRRFLARCGLNDPREGRGLFPTFNARYWWWRCPIDHVLVHHQLQCDRLEIGDFVGSDHFPVLAEVSFRRG